MEAYRSALPLYASLLSASAAEKASTSSTNASLLVELAIAMPAHKFARQLIWRLRTQNMEMSQQL